MRATETQAVARCCHAQPRPGPGLQVALERAAHAPDSRERRKGDLWVTSAAPIAPLIAGAIAPCGVLALLPAGEGRLRLGSAAEGAGGAAGDGGRGPQKECPQPLPSCFSCLATVLLNVSLTTQRQSVQRANASTYTLPPRAALTRPNAPLTTTSRRCSSSTPPMLVLPMPSRICRSEHSGLNRLTRDSRPGSGLLAPRPSSGGGGVPEEAPE